MTTTRAWLYAALFVSTAVLQPSVHATAQAVPAPSPDSSIDMSPAEIRVGIQAFTDFQVIAVLAEQQGYFKQLNLKVSFIQVPTAAAGEAAIFGGSLDVLTAGGEGFLANDKGAGVRLIAGTANRSAAHFFTQASITNLEQLKGMPIGGSGPAAAGATQARLGLIARGLKQEDLKFVTSGSSSVSIKALIAGNLTATTLSLPWNYVAAKEGLKDWGFTDAPWPDGLGAPSMIFGAYMTTTTVLGKKRSAVERFLAGFRATVLDLYNPATRPVLAKAVSDSMAIELDYVIADYKTYFDDPKTKGTFIAEDGHVDFQATKNTCLAYLDIQLLKPGTDCDTATKEFIDDKSIQNAEKYLKLLKLGQTGLTPPLIRAK